MPLRRMSLKGVPTFLKRFVQYGLMARYSTRLRPATISANGPRFKVVVMTSNVSPRGAKGCGCYGESRNPQQPKVGLHYLNIT